MSAGFEPKVLAIAANVVEAMRPTVPFQPECASPIASRTGSYRKTGGQSADSAVGTVHKDHEGAAP